MPEVSGISVAFDRSRFENLLRLRMVRQGRLPVGMRSSPHWTVQELLYHAYRQDEALLSDVLVVRLTGGLGDLIDVTAWNPLHGRRIIRLRYFWKNIEPYSHLRPEVLSETVLAEMASQSGVLRAVLREKALTGLTPR